MSENNSAHREELMFRSKVNVIHTKKELEPTPMTPYVASKVTFFSNQVCTLTIKERFASETREPLEK